MQTLRRTRAPRWVTNVCIQVAGVVQVRVNWFETMLWYGQLILAGLLYLGIGRALLIQTNASTEETPSLGAYDGGAADQFQSIIL